MTRPRPQLSLPSLKPLRAGLPAAGPLGLALAAALVGHGLLLAPNPWRRSPAKAQVLTAEDTTPELLRFSRRMPQEVAATTIPLPPATTLPPPPLDLLGPLPKNAAKVAGTAKTPAAITAKAGTQRPETKSSKIQLTLLLKPSQAPSPGAHGGGTAPSLALARATGAKAQSTPGQATKGPGTKGGSKDPKGAPASSPTAEAAGTTHHAMSPSPLRLSPSPPAEALQRWRDLRASGEAAPPPPASGPGSEALKASEAAPYLRLWDQAAPASFAAGTDSALSDGVQARRLPLAAARALGLDPGQQQWLKAADQSLLVWIDGPNLWLLKGPIPPEKPGR
ncbi:MAG: hypothetical protein NTZ40_11915 [Cyanobacteria bacterium]|nr:hypothetical protein [Cyanobacteriota bacterium]